MVTFHKVANSMQQMPFFLTQGGYPVVRSKAGTSPPQLLSEQLAAVMSIARES